MDIKSILDSENINQRGLNDLLKKIEKLESYQIINFNYCRQKIINELKLEVIKWYNTEKILNSEKN
jgi:hypothetical protein